MCMYENTYVFTLIKKKGKVARPGVLVRCGRGWGWLGQRKGGGGLKWEWRGGIGNTSEKAGKYYC